VNQDVAGRPVLRQPRSRLEGEQYQAERPAVDQPCLPVTVLRRVWLGPKPLREIGKIEEHGRPEESVARMRPESFVRHLASRLAAWAAFLMFLRAAAFCFVVAIADLLSPDVPDHRLTGVPGFREA
jgi:hypothetical protein